MRGSCFVVLVGCEPRELVGIPPVLSSSPGGVAEDNADIKRGRR